MKSDNNGDSRMKARVYTKKDGKFGTFTVEVEDPIKLRCEVMFKVRFLVLHDYAVYDIIYDDPDSVHGNEEVA